jgi:hypothetical protein
VIRQRLGQTFRPRRGDVIAAEIDGPQGVAFPGQPGHGAGAHVTDAVGAEQQMHDVRMMPQSNGDRRGARGADGLFAQIQPAIG